MRTIYFAVLMAVIWGAFYTIVPRLQGNVPMVIAFGLAAWVSVVLAAVAMGKGN